MFSKQAGGNGASVGDLLVASTPCCSRDLMTIRKLQNITRLILHLVLISSCFSFLIAAKLSAFIPNSWPENIIPAWWVIHVIIVTQHWTLNMFPSALKKQLTAAVVLHFHIWYVGWCTHSVQEALEEPLHGVETGKHLLVVLQHHKQTQQGIYSVHLAGQGEREVTLTKAALTLVLMTRKYYVII